MTVPGFGAVIVLFRAFSPLLESGKNAFETGLPTLFGAKRARSAFSYITSFFCNLSSLKIHPVKDFTIL